MGGSIVVRSHGERFHFFRPALDSLKLEKIDSPCISVNNGYTELRCLLSDILAVANAF
jgi:hypothetical protein